VDGLDGVRVVVHAGLAILLLFLLLLPRRVHISLLNATARSSYNTSETGGQLGRRGCRKQGRRGRMFK
jgi:hypothetical protein